MARSALTGSRIRERRTLGGVKQADLARRVGISASYLNLIEHNRRKIGDGLLRRIAEALAIDPAVLSEGAEAALLEGLRDAAGGAGDAERSGGDRPELDRIEEFVGRFPGWAAALDASHARVALLERTVEALSDRMTHDPWLSAALHEVLSSVTSVRSTAAILVETEDIEPEWRARFHGNLHADSVRLARGAEALVAYLDGSVPRESGVAAPQDEMEAWLGAAGHHFPGLESGAEQAEALVAAAPGLTSASARRLARVWLDRYAEDARRLPLAALRAALSEAHGDPGRVAQRCGVDLATALRRIAVLPEGAKGGAGLVICDGAGALTFRKPAEGFALPRFGAACPLWPLYQALSRPMVPIRALVEVAGRTPRRYLTYAVCQAQGPAGFDHPPVLEATMLILPEPEPAGAEPAQPIGTTCRICPRASCPARREPSILTEEF